jgi:hypothetical protein
MLARVSMGKTLARASGNGDMAARAGGGLGFLAHQGGDGGGMLARVSMGKTLARASGNGGIDTTDGDDVGGLLAALDFEHGDACSAHPALDDTSGAIVQVLID